MTDIATSRIGSERTGTAAKVVLKRIHLVATAWFVVCAGYLVGAGLRQVGFNWWAVLSLSGYSTGMLLILVSFYLFALYRGVGSVRRTEAEHPLTSATWYMGLYVSAPLLAALVAATGTEAVPGTSGHLIHVALGTLKGTFAAWIVVDPLVGAIETLSTRTNDR
ncbi:MAG: hypothetical protein ABFE13_05935 [Phycisphaerales bacterium]